MTFITEDTRRAARSWLKRQIDGSIITGYPGRPLGNNQYELRVPGQPGWIYLRIQGEDEDAVELVSAYNIGAAPDPTLLVHAELLRGKYYILRPDAVAATELYGESSESAAVPPHSGAVGGGNVDPVTGTRFLPLTATPVDAANSMEIYVWPGQYYNPVTGLAMDWPGGVIDLAPVVPAVSEEQGPILVGVDRNDTLGALDGTTVPLGTQMTRQDFLDIDQTVVPLMGILLVEGQTDLTDWANIIVDLRPFVSLPSNIVGSMTVVEGAAPATPASGEAALFVDTADSHLKIKNDAGTITDLHASATSTPYILLQGQKAISVAAGAFNSGSWVVRELSNEVTDTGNNCTLASNEFTLLAGTYEIIASAPAFAVNRHQTRLYNVTDAAVAIVGTADYANRTNSSECRSFIYGRFTIASSKAFRIEHRCETSQAGNGLGVESPWDIGVFTVVQLHKVA